MPEEDARLATARWLASAEASGPLADARRAVDAFPRDPLRAGAQLRGSRPTLDATRAAALLEQADLGRTARERYGLDVDLLLTRDGLEAATRPAVAGRRARLLAAAGVERVLDITGGLGFDDAAFAAAGLDVTAVERDPATATFLSVNCPGIRVVAADSTQPGLLADLLGGLAPTDVVFADPARRDPHAPRDAATARARPERDPERWSPPWSAVAALPHPRVAAKAAPSLTPPPGWEAEWVSVDRTVVELSLYSWPLSGVARRAVVLGTSTVTVVDADDASTPVAEEVGTWLHEPDPAVLRASALAALARGEEARLVGEASTWLTSGHPSSSPALRSHLVVAELTGSPRAQRRQLAELGVARVTVKSRDVAAEPREVLRDLRVREGGEHVVVLTRRGGRVISLLTQPAVARSR